MRAVLIFLLFAGLLPVAAAQQVLIGRVLHAETGTPVAYAHVGIAGKEAGTVTDLQGGFRLSAKKVATGDTLRISMLGFSTLDWVIPSLMPARLPDFQLDSIAYLLPTVDFLPQGIPIVLGDPPKRLTKQVWGAGGLASGEELGRLFELENGPVRLDTFRFHLRRNNSDSMLFRLNLYTASADGWPRESLLDRDIRFKVVKGENEAEDGWVTVDLSDEDLILEGDFVATIELLRNWVGFGYSPIFVSFTVGRERALVRLSSQAPWQKHKRRRPFAFIFEGKK